ncbi:DUF305 domain-containing protein [Nocardia asteroides]|uniref:DUF305 domain-containing protein n=1 Tax=Nocardia asteroides TaxID=1824 RepID=UPI001E5E0719|nr:DUF305 domain-containing protein [Nocardia asteroides]UGT64330.1 DUF305 domain-containing protein [Nocardia asteroides]
MKIIVRLLAAAFVAAAALLATGCGGGDSAPAPAPTTARNGLQRGDVEFLQGMAAQQEQSAEIAGLAANRAVDQRVRELAVTLRQDRGPESARITALLDGFGEQAGTGMEGSGQLALLGPGRIAAVAAATGVEFDGQWLDLVVEHHGRAVALAQSELAAGIDPETQALARDIVTARQAGIDAARALRG